MPPLPPAPAKRAAVLPAQAYADRDAHNAAARKTRSARATPAQSRKTAAQATQAPALALNAVVPAAQPAAQPPASQPPAARPAVKTPAKAAKSRRAAAPEAVKLFVLDTNVLLHDPTALFRFEEHDIFLPMVVLEELDAHKKGASEIARNARQVSRQLDLLVAHADMAAGLPLSAGGHLEAGGKL